jgi:hypothetical protein
MKINVWKVIVSHFKTLVNHNTRKPGLDDWCIFLIIPVVVASLLVWFKKDVSTNTVNLIITSLSIFVGLLINVLVLVFSLLQKEKDSKLKVIVLRETIVNITYVIIISVISILFCFCMNFDNYVLRLLITFLIYLLTVHFFVTLMMVVKRMYSLFVNEMEDFEKIHGTT